MRNAILTGMLVTFGATTAQAQSEGRMIRGVVTDTAGRPIAYVNLQTTGQGRGATNDSGAFVYRVPGKGDVTMRVYRLGYEPQFIKLAAGGDTSIRVALTPVSRALEAIEVESSRINKRLQAHGFYDRLENRQKGIGAGTFFTREDIEDRKPVRITQMIEGVSGLRLVRKAIKPNQRSAAEGNNEMPINSMEDWIIQGPGYCTYSVYLDGTLISPRRDMRGENRGLPVDPFLSPQGTAAIEVYPRGPGVPTQYAAMGESCGVVLFWSK